MTTPAKRAPPSSLVEARALETLEAAYDEWRTLQLEHAAAYAEWARERKRLEEEGAFVLGAVRAAQASVQGGEGPLLPGGAGLATRPEGSLQEVAAQAQRKLEEARSALSRREAEQAEAFAARLAEVRRRVRERVSRYAAAFRPRLELWVRPLAGGRRILHLRRVSGDEAVVLLHLFSGAIPSRYGFLFDDSLDEPGLPAPLLYPDEGVQPSELRPGATALRERVKAGAEVLPIRGFLPVLVARPDGGEDLFRLLQRGPVMEAELADGESFRSLLEPAEAERLAGYLLGLKLAERIELSVTVE